MIDNKTDEELMEMYQKGSEPAFRVLYERHAGKVLGFIKSRIKNEEIASDIFQEVFSKFHKSKSLYKREYRVLPWIFVITRTAIIDSLRKEKKFERVESNLNEFSQDLDAASGISAITDHFTKLEQKQRQVLEMRYVEDKTFENIAAELGTTEMNVRQIVSRGIKRLKQLIGANDDENKK